MWASAQNDTGQAWTMLSARQCGGWGDLSQGFAMNDFPIVCVGGSAGGLGAYVRLLRNLPRRLGGGVWRPISGCKKGAGAPSPS